MVHNGDRRIVGLPLYGYNPTTEWQFIVGAGAGPHGDTHRIDSLRIRSGELIYETSVPLAVSVNGLEFTQVPGGYKYFTPPVASSVSPASGPAYGGTVITITGFGFGAATQPECRFDGKVVATPRTVEGRGVSLDLVDLSITGGEVVNASVLNETHAWCISPGGGRLNTSTRAGVQPYEDIGVMLSLNGVWDPVEAVAKIPWLLRSIPIVSGFAPVSGPLSGGTLVSIHGYAFAKGVDYRCRFGSINRTVFATFDTVVQQLRCRAPPGDRWDAGEASAAPLEGSHDRLAFARARALKGFYHCERDWYSREHITEVADGLTVVKIVIAAPDKIYIGMAGRTLSQVDVALAAQVCLATDPLQDRVATRKYDGHPIDRLPRAALRWLCRAEELLETQLVCVFATRQHEIGRVRC